MSKQDGRGRQVTEAPSSDTSASILHMDMDAFFASVELLERPELVGKPVIVGHRSLRSVVTAATYEARKYGVNSAMPMAVALRRCPQAIVLEPHFERYTHYSAQVMRLLGEVTPLVEPLSIDEAFLDVAGALKLLGTPWQIGTRLRERIHSETGLRASVGAAATKYVAKLASSRAKPDGLLVVPLAETVTFLHPQPVSALWGVGGKAEEQLARLGLRTIGDVAEVPLDALTRAVGPANAARLHDLAWGRDPRSIDTDRSEKSIGHETTFETDVTDPAVIHRTLLGLSDGVAVRLRRAESRPAPSRSSSASRTSARSRAPARSPSRQTSPAGSTRSRGHCTTQPPRAGGRCGSSASAVSSWSARSRRSACGMRTRPGAIPSTPLTR